MECIDELAEALCDLNDMILRLVSPSVGSVLTAYLCKHVALMRELQFICQTSDQSGMVGLFLGLPLVSWTASAVGLMERIRGPICRFVVE